MPWNEDTATIDAGDKSVTVTHGVGTTPLTITITPAQNIGSRGVWYSDVGATTFKINISSADPFTDFTFGWRAGLDAADEETPSDYTTEAKVEALTQVTISTTSVPSTGQVSVWIDEVSSEIVERGLSTHVATDQYLDIPLVGEGSGVYEPSYNVKSGILRFNEGEGNIVPLRNIHHPIISITSLYKNDQSYTGAASWEELTEGPGASSHFLLLESDERGYALWFYDDQPLAGPKRVKLTYTYGLAVPNNILARWATRKVAIDVLEARMGTNSVDGLSYIDAGDFGVSLNTRYRERIEEWRTDIEDIEKKYFPKDTENSRPVYTVF